MAERTYYGFSSSVDLVRFFGYVCYPERRAGNSFAREPRRLDGFDFRFSLGICRSLDEERREDKRLGFVSLLLFMGIHHCSRNHGVAVFWPGKRPRVADGFLCITVVCTGGVVIAYSVYFGLDVGSAAVEPRSDGSFVFDGNQRCYDSRIDFDR